MNWKRFYIIAVVFVYLGSCAFAANTPTVSFEVSADNSKIYYTLTQDNSYTFSQPESVEITGESLSQPQFLIDRYGNLSIVCLAHDPNTQLNRIILSSLPSFEPRSLFTSQAELTELALFTLNNPEKSLAISWHQDYLGGKATYLIVSPDNGLNFCSPKLIEDDVELADIHEFILDKPDTPLINFPTANSVVNSNNLVIDYLISGNEPLLCKIKLSATLQYKQTASTATQESIKFSCPTDLPEGKYALTISAFDGVNTSLPCETINFVVDNTPPELTSLEAARIEDQLIFKGTMSEALVDLTINSTAVSFGSETEFIAQLPLISGNNLFTFVLTDEAGNSAMISEEVFYNPASPEITVLSPAITDWFKPESTIIVEARVFDLQQDIAEESEATLAIDGQELETPLTYDKEESSLFGFISLPEDLSEGIHTATISLSDVSGNKSSTTFAINIDGTPPQLNASQGQNCYLNSDSEIRLPLTDSGAGIDLSGTIISISGISFEGTASLEGTDLVFTVASLLVDGTYEVELIPRDQIGNLGKPLSLGLIVDTTAPTISLTSSCEPQTTQTRVMIQGNVADENPASIKIHNNQKEVADFELNGFFFSKEISLTTGNNNILIEAFDKSGNKSEVSFTTLAQVATSTTLIQECINAPNPFSPTKKLIGAFADKGRGMVFAYSLAQPADVRIRIYDLTGTLIWTKVISDATSGVTAWSGENAFGQQVSNGIYPYIFSVSANGKKEFKKGKIIVYQ